MRLMLLLSMWLVGCTDLCGKASGRRPQAPITYVLASDPRYAVTFNDTYVAIGMRDPPLGWGERRRDCSDETLECSAAGRLVFAIPRRAAHAGFDYTAEGVRFRIDRCLDSECARVIVRADCEVFGEGRCRLSDAAVDDETAGFMTYFVFDRRVGVVSMGFDLERISNRPDIIQQISEEYVLEGANGILSGDRP